MDINKLLDQMLQSGKELTRKGQAVAEDKLGVPEQGQQRDAMISGLKKGAAAAGVLALLLGTRTGRRATGMGLKIGSLAALGGIAYQMYNQWQNPARDGDGLTVTQDSPALLGAPEQAPVMDGKALLTAMVAAAKADGHVDQAELAHIRSKLAELDAGEDLNDLLLTELARPVSVADVARLAGGDRKAALELYLASAIMLDTGNEAENMYLADLQAALGLPDEALTLTVG